MTDLEENARPRAAGKEEIPLSPFAIEIVRRINVLFEIERPINGKTPDGRGAVCKSKSKPLVGKLLLYMREQRAKRARTHEFTKATNYIVTRRDTLTLFSNDGRVCVPNNAAERVLHGIAGGKP